MARIAIIALMLLASVGALAQQADPGAPAPAAPGGTTTPAPAQAEPSQSAPHPNPLSRSRMDPTSATNDDRTRVNPSSDAGGEREHTEQGEGQRSEQQATPPAEAPPAPDAPPATAPSAEAPAPAPPSPPRRVGDADLRESVCLMIESAARAHNLPLEFFARVIWQESRFQPNVVGPRTRSGDRAQGIAQFMPRTAAERGLFDPFDPVQALPKSAEFLRELADQFGNLGLAAAAYNAGPGRVREFLSARRSLPAETRHYVLAITGISVDEWAASGKREPAPVAKPGCGELMALLHRAPNPFVQKLEQRVNVVAAAPWGVQLAAGFSRDHALSNYAMLAKRYATVLEGRDPSLLSTLLRSRGTQPFYQVRVGADTRAAAETLCGSIRRAGGACFVLRNRG
jgi:soluble lytic murein transglycosylase-like protein